MANITVYLKVDEVGHLHLRDSEGHSGEDNITTYAKDGDSLTWVLEENSGIRKIVSIAAKPGNQNIFSEGPERISDVEWRGVIGPAAQGSESYFIEYELTDGSILTDDPVVVVDPH
jgi:hypothetical protein